MTAVLKASVVVLQMSSQVHRQVLCLECISTSQETAIVKAMLHSLSIILLGQLQRASTYTVLRVRNF